jgi:hypothetical protein
MRRVPIALGAGLLGLLTACSSPGQPSHPGHPSASATAKPAQLTSVEAKAAFGSFLPRFEQIPTKKALIPVLTTGVEAQAQEFFQGRAGPPLGSPTAEAFYVPRLTGYPRWFLAAGHGAKSADFALVMVQQSASSPWKCAAELIDWDSASHLLQALTAVDQDAQGYAAVIPPDDPSLAVAPSSLSQAYASLLNAGARGTGAKLFAAGTNTTGYVAINRRLAAHGRQYGWRITDSQRGTAGPIYALALGTGALVIYLTKDTAAWEAVSSSAVLPGSASKAASYYAPPSFMVGGMAKSAVRPGLRLTASAADSVLALVPPKGQGKVDVLVNTGEATSYTTLAG